MSKIVINYDLMDKIDTINGDHSLKLMYKYDLKTNKLGNSMYVFLCAHDIIINHMSDYYNIGMDLETIGIWTGLYAIWVPVIYHTVDFIRTKYLNGMSYDELAYEDLVSLSLLLNNHNIKTNVDFLLQSKVYHKNYKLDMEGSPGVIRHRYINIPTYNELGKEQETSILEEHKIGSKDYYLSLGEPEKKKVLKLVYGS